MNTVTRTVGEIEELDNGFTRVELDFTEDEFDDIALAWVRRTCTPASVSILEEYIAEGRSLEEAVYNTIVNEAVIDAIKLGTESDKLVKMSDSDGLEITEEGC